MVTIDRQPTHWELKNLNDMLMVAFQALSWCEDGTAFPFELAEPFGFFDIPVNEAGSAFWELF